MGTEPESDDPTSYWFDAVDDVDLSSIDFGNFDLSAIDFDFGEIDRILESINDQPPLALPTPPPLPPPPAEPVIVENMGQVTVEEKLEAVNVDKRCSKKSRIESDRVENRKFYLARDDRSGERYRRDIRKWGRHGEERERSRKRERDWDRRDSRDRDRGRENRGYWARDSIGKLTFKTGSWEAVDLHRDAKKAKFESLDEGKKSPLKEEKKEKPVEEQARKYQLDVLEQAKTKNTIAFLETGAGKTLIAVLLIKSMYNDMMKENKKMLAIFLVPKVPLVYQQAEVIREKTGYKVGHYCGDMGQDFWDTRRWQREFESKQAQHN